jgi:hypothetical protein
LLRNVWGIFLVLCAIPCLIMGGLSRDAVPAHPAWTWISIGLFTLAVGSVLTSPLARTSGRKTGRSCA